MSPAELFFGPFLFEPRLGRLTKHGHRIKLQPKPAAILACLLERPGEVVSRKQLQTVLWPEGTYVDFEAGIKVAMRKLRDALGDSSEEPIYVQTVYGGGYRFIAPVIPTTHELTGAQQTRDLVPRDGDRMPEGQAPRRVSALHAEARTTWRGTRLVWVLTAAGFIVAAALALLSAGTRTTSFQPRDWLLMAAFENRTGDKLLDGSMEFALERELGHSQYVNVAPPERIADTLRLMRQSPTAPLNEDLARQVAIRDGAIRAVLAGRIEKFGTQFVLTVRVVNPRTGAAVAAFDRRVREGQLPDAARSIAADLRRALGESAKAVEAQAATLEKATTPSLAALYAFSAGMKSVNERQWRPAAELLEEALQKDPDFALAHVYLAYCYRNLDQEDRAAPHFDAAFRLASGVHERERLFILGSYYARRMHDDWRALGAYEALVKMYPDDFWGVNNLAGLYRRLGMFKEWTATTERRLALRPNDPNEWPFIGQLWWYYRRTQPDPGKARQFKEKLLRLVRTSLMSRADAEFVTVNFELETAADRWWVGDVKGAGTELARVSAAAVGKSDEYLMRLARVNEVVGRIRAAWDLCGQVRDVAWHSECLLRVAYASDDRTLAEKFLNDLRLSSPSPGGKYLDSWIAAWFDQNTLARSWSGPGADIEALFHLKEGHPYQAILKAKAELPVLFIQSGQTQIWMRMVQASALGQQGKSEDAMTVLEQETKPAHIDFYSGFPWPRARLQLADLYRKAGRTADATRVEDEIRHFLSEADPDHPVLVRLRGRK